MGFNTLPNGVPFIGFRANGDWAAGVFGIIYWDGEDLRRFLPIEGNLFNRITLRAYGDDEKYDEEDAKLRFAEAGLNLETMIKQLRRPSDDRESAIHNALFTHFRNVPKMLAEFGRIANAS